MARTFILVLILCCLSLLHYGCGEHQNNVKKETGNIEVRDTCDQPDADPACSFIYMPSTLTSIMDIGYHADAGDPIILYGTVYKSDGKTPFPGVILYAYQTDHTGIYPKRGNEKGVHKWHGYLHGWCKTDAAGHYEIHTIKPGIYPDMSTPAHVHVTVKEPSDKAPYFIPDFFFEGDEVAERKNMSPPPGSNAVVSLEERDGKVYGRRDIVLPD